MTKLGVSQAETNSGWPKSPFMSNFCLIPGGKQNAANNTMTQKVQIAQSLWSESRGRFCRVCPWEEGHEQFQGSLTCFFKEIPPPWRQRGCLKGPLSPHLCPSPPLLPGSWQRTQTMQSWHFPNCGYFRWRIESVFSFSQADRNTEVGLAEVGYPNPSNFRASLPASRLQQQLHASAPSFADTPSLLLKVWTKQRILLNISRKRGHDSLADILPKPTLGRTWR